MELVAAPPTRHVPLHLALSSWPLLAASNPVPSTGASAAVPALQGDLMDEWRVGVSIDGMVCVKVLPKAGIALA